MPICKPCKTALKRKARLEAIGIFLLWTLICWGIPAIPAVMNFLVNLVSRLGFPWGLFPPLLLIGTPLIGLYSIFVLGSVGWPLWHKQKSGGGESFSHTIALNDEEYVRLLAAANSPKIWDLTDWAAKPPNKLIHPSKGVLDPSLKDARLSVPREPEESGVDSR